MLRKKTVYLWLAFHKHQKLLPLPHSVNAAKNQLHSIIVSIGTMGSLLVLDSPCDDVNDKKQLEELNLI